MYKVFKSIIFIVWLLDVMNLSVSGISWLAWLEPVLNDGNGLNTLFWFVVWCFLPATSVIASKDED